MVSMTCWGARCKPCSSVQHHAALYSAKFTQVQSGKPWNPAGTNRFLVTTTFRVIVLAAFSASSAPLYADQGDYLGQRMPYAAFDALPKTTLEVGGGRLDVAFAPGLFALSKARVCHTLIFVIGSQTLAVSRAPSRWRRFLFGRSPPTLGSGIMEDSEEHLEGEVARRMAAAPMIPQVSAMPKGRRPRVRTPVAHNARQFPTVQYDIPKNSRRLSSGLAAAQAAPGASQCAVMSGCIRSWCGRRWLREGSRHDDRCG